MARKLGVTHDELAAAGFVSEPNSPAQFPSQFPAQFAPEIPDDGADALLAELGTVTDEGAKVNIYRAASNGRKVEAWLYSCAPAEFSIEDLAARFGGGEYRIKGYRYSGELGKRILFVNQAIAIDGPAKHPEEKPVAPAAPVFDPAPLVQMMQQGFERMTQILATVHTAQPAPKSTVEIAQELMALRSLFAPSNEKAPSMSDMIEILKSGIELGKNAVGGDDSDPLTEMTRGLMPLLGKLAERAENVPQSPPAGVSHNPAPAIPATVPATIPAPVVAPSAAQRPATGAADMNGIDPRLAMGVSFLTAQAANGGDPEFYAEFVLDQIGDEAALALLAMPDWFDRLCQVAPAAQKHQAWFIQLTDAMRALLTDEAEPAQTSAQPMHAPAPDADKPKSHDG